MLQRGLYEDYVANFWCTSSRLVKWKQLLSQQQLVQACTLATLAGLLPSMASQVLRPSKKGLVLCMANSAMAFFLFSYQVRGHRLTSASILCCRQAGSCGLPAESPHALSPIIHWAAALTSHINAPAPAGP